MLDFLPGLARFTAYLRLGLDLGGKFVGFLAGIGRDLGRFTAYLRLGLDLGGKFVGLIAGFGTIYRLLMTGTRFRR